ncbi:MAG: trans-sulfuration enzyme family protein [Streptosporangiaceae bacterium]
MASDQPGENTRAVHLPPAPVPAQRPLGTPVYRTAAFAFSSSAEYAALLNGEADGYSYSRIDNPTADAFAIAVAALEGQGLDRTSPAATSPAATSPAAPTAAQAFASGMAAISTVFWTFTGTGGHVVAPAAVYGGTYGFLRHVAARFGVQTDFVDMTDLDQVRAAVRPETRIVYAETVANPTTAVADLPALAEIAHAHGALLVVDSTMAPPVICRPLEHGADLVLHSATKYLGGHSDTTGGVVSGAPGLIGQVRAVRVDTGGALAPDEAFLLRRGLETLPLRVRRQCSTAMLFAAAVARHPAVRRVDYPGLPGHPGHQTAIRLFDAGPEGTRFGAIVTVTPHGGRQAGYELADRLRVGQVATSLGGTHTVVSHVASTTHRQFDDAALAAAGMDPGAVRFSIGLEDGEDLIADVRQALDGLGSAGPGGRPPGVPSRGTTPGTRESPARGEHASGAPPLAGESGSREERA